VIKNLWSTRDPESYWRSRGWGSEWRFPAMGPRGETLAFSIRAPLDWSLVDVRKLPDADVSPPGSVAQAMVKLRDMYDAAGMIAVLGMEHTIKREHMPDAHLFATISVALADNPDPRADALLGADVQPFEYSANQRPYRGMRARGITTAEVVPGRRAKPVITVQYLMRCDYGVLAIMFATPQREFDRLMPLFDKIASASWLHRRG
jgi:hypothetical protein